ncbi:hypothetical protein LPB72_21335 [Hydrogenophaga crassostreae]|uniref:Glutathione S-transferase n=1 Tax=Hydrogenophaga crassostreae TaxID=1763535 RepID=A0A167GJA3_9BURK|nr:glutathione S-transferase [Hydrogenophaga crassostreae]AOW15070.1 hypothetical protein LPB072_21950 [Hydrogenophaga crassostreae]OAD39523.1 hypothetical protein LPB72_21335 [Hydrogenophaga crassostreae]
MEPSTLGALPVLYSFRRCPYAIRARMALLQAGLVVELREVVLRDKPQAMLDASPKGTVPVLQLPGGQVIDESLGIMRWALAQNDPQEWLGQLEDPMQQQLLSVNDGPFKQALDAYKYPERHPQLLAEGHRTQGEMLLISVLEQRLDQHAFLAGVSPGFVDVAIFPFVRQWAAVDAGWFESCQWPAVRQWLQHWLRSPAFLGVMPKYPAWKPGQSPERFPAPTIA